MAEKIATGGSNGSDIEVRDSAAYTLDHRRRAALAEVDNAGFSSVYSKFLTGNPSLSILGGSISKSVS